MPEGLSPSLPPRTQESRLVARSRNALRKAPMWLCLADVFGDTLARRSAVRIASTLVLGGMPSNETRADVPATHDVYGSYYSRRTNDPNEFTDRESLTNDTPPMSQ